MPGTVDLSPTAVLSTAGASSNVVNPDLKQPHVRQVTGSFEHQLAANLALRVGYIYNRIMDDYQFVNTLRPNTPEVWSVPVVKQVPDHAGNILPGAPTITLYDYGLGYRGADFVRNMQVNRLPEYDDNFQTLESALTKRGAKWTLLTSFSATKNHRWIAGMPSDPNVFFPVDNTWLWGYKVSGSYELPLEFRVGWLANVLSGTKGQETYTFTGLPQTRNLTLPIGQFGDMKGPLRIGSNLRITKILPFGKARRMQLDFDLLNLTNSGAAWATTYLAGQNFGRVTSIDNPRIARFGVTFDF